MAKKPTSKRKSRKSGEAKELKATPGTPTPPPKVFHVHPLSPERDHLAIEFPRVEGYVHRVATEVTVAWDRGRFRTLRAAAAFLDAAEDLLRR